MTVRKNPKYWMLICTITILIRVNINIDTSPQCHACTRMGTRGAAMSPCMPRRIHVGSREYYPLFVFILINLTL